VRVKSTSVAAFHTSPIASLRERVLEIIESYGEDGCIQDDVIATFRKGLSSDESNTGRVTGRFSELEDAGLIVRLGDTRRGASGKQQLIMRAAVYAKTVTAAPSKPVGRKSKQKRNPFLKGMMHVAKVLIKQPDFGTAARAALKAELIKAAGK